MMPEGSAFSAGFPRRSARNHHASSMLFLLLLFASLVLTGELLICMGTGVYEEVLSSMNDNSNLRTASAYIRQKLRQNSDRNALRVDTLDGCDAIVLQQYLGDDFYETYLYCYDGELRELMIRQGTVDSFAADSGTAIASMDAMSIEEMEEGNILLAAMAIDGTTQELVLGTGGVSNYGR